MPNIIDVLKERGFIDALTSEEIREIVQKPIRVYCGFDPTADSLHIGNLVAIMGLAWFQRYGHTPVAIVGGATGMIGDPSGRTSQRQLLTEETIEHNLKGIQKNLETVLRFGDADNKPLILNNYDWYKNISSIQFLRETGSLFRVGSMLAKDSVRSRLQSEEGMSYTEFSYQVLQGYDFLHLFRTYQVSIQLGGSDQWGNITAGTDLIRRVEAQPAYGITFPLLTKSDGQKFGKSEKGAVWLSADKFSPYEFYQYLIRIEDADVIQLMRLLTFMEMDEIHQYEALMQQPNYAPRTAQKKLAAEVTALVHGIEGLEAAKRITEGLAPGAKTQLNREILENLAHEMDCKSFKAIDVIGKKLIDFLVEIALQNSKGDARRLIKNGGVSINNERVSDENFSITEVNLIDQKLMLIATGKKNKVLIKIIHD